jgi:hypothetical protein
VRPGEAGQRIDRAQAGGKSPDLLRADMAVSCVLRSIALGGLVVGHDVVRGRLQSPNGQISRRSLSLRPLLAESGHSRKWPWPCPFMWSTPANEAPKRNAIPQWVLHRAALDTKSRVSFLQVAQ